jgi:amidase
VAPIVGEEVIVAVNDTGALLRSLGHAVEPRDPAWGPLSSNFMPRYLRGISDEVARAPHPERLERRTRGFARIGALIPDSALRRSRAIEREDRRRVLALFEDFDVLVTPVMGGTAVPVRKWEGMGAVRTLNGMSRFYPFCAPWNHLGCPAAAVPAGFADDGLPLSVQLIAPPGEEGRLLSVAAQLEAERPWADAKPPL